MKYRVGFAFLAFLFSLTEIHSSYEPIYRLFGDPSKIHFDSDRKVFINRNRNFDNWMALLSQEQYEEVSKQPDTPARKTFRIVLKKEFYNKPEVFYAQAILTGAIQKRRFVLINVEQASDKDSFVERANPHLGVLYIGTVAKEEGYEVVLWDELIQGYVNLEKLIEPGDVVGFSLIVTGMIRGIELAHQSKALGAGLVIAGNDSAIFRANQILALPGKPIDVVFTSNSLNSVRRFLREYNGKNLAELVIPEMQTVPGEIQHSNAGERLTFEFSERKSLRIKGEYDSADGFIIPDFNLFPKEYWEQVWSNYRTQSYGQKHSDPDSVRHALGLLAQGCTRTQGLNACSYCSIYGIGDVRVPSEKHLIETVDAYKKFGINSFFNVTDSAYEMMPLIQRLERINASFEALTIYGRAQGIALQPKLLDRWLRLVNSRLLINVGMDSGDERMLSQGVSKSSIATRSSRVEENRTAIRVVRASGAHLHYSLIFGSPGESKESCERSMEFLQWSADTLGQQLDRVETDLYWLNFGSPASEVFYNFDYARKLAGFAGKNISSAQWYQNFGSHKNDFVVSWETERNWYRYFTRIDFDEAQEYNRRAVKVMSRVSGSLTGRAFNPIKEV